MEQEWFRSYDGQGRVVPAVETHDNYDDIIKQMPYPGANMETKLSDIAQPDPVGVPIQLSPPQEVTLLERWYVTWHFVTIHGGPVDHTSVLAVWAFGPIGAARTAIALLLKTHGEDPEIDGVAHVSDLA